MPLINVLVILVVFVVCFWAVNTYLPESPPVRLIANLFLVLLLILWLLHLIGLMPSLSTYRVG